MWLGDRRMGTSEKNQKYQYRSEDIGKEGVIRLGDRGMGTSEKEHEYGDMKFRV